MRSFVPLQYASILITAHGAHPFKGFSSGNDHFRLRMSLSKRQVARGRASQWRNSPIQPVLSQIETGRESQRFRQQNQSIVRPINLAPTLMEKRSISSRGPSSATSKDANLQRARATATWVKHQIEILLSICFFYAGLCTGTEPLVWATSYGLVENDRLC
jgi:hypothetical protein